MSPEMQLRYVSYVVDSEGHASPDSFEEDFDPIGGIVLKELIALGFVEVYMGRVCLTNAGDKLYYENRLKPKS